MALTYKAGFLAVSIAPNQIAGDRTLTLGELLYADPTVALVSEKQWLSVVRAIAAGDEAALRLLYEKAFPVVFTYLMRLTGNRHLTDTLILDLFELVWCEAPVFATDGPVLGWIMRRARSLALNHTGSARSAHGDSGYVALEMPTGPVPMRDGDHRVPMSPSLQRALETLTMDEYQAIEATFLSGLSYAEFAKQSGQHVGTVKSQIRSGFAKLQQAMHVGSEAT